MKCKHCRWSHGLRLSSYNDRVSARLLRLFFAWVRCDLCGMVFRARGPLLGGKLPRAVSIEAEMLRRTLATVDSHLDDSSEEGREESTAVVPLKH